MKNKIPPASVKRLPLYLSCLGDINEGKGRVSSEKLADLAKVNPAQVRRDLSYLGTLGTRGVGYDITTLKNQLEIELGLVKGWTAIIVGAGNLGSALAQYDGFKEKGFGIVGLYDVDPKKHIQAAELLKGSNIENPGPESLPYELIKLMKELGVPSGIRELGYEKKDISEIIVGAIKQQRLLSIAPKIVSEKDLNQILIQSIENW